MDAENTAYGPADDAPVELITEDAELDGDAIAYLDAGVDVCGSMWSR